MSGCVRLVPLSWDYKVSSLTLGLQDGWFMVVFDTEFKFDLLLKGFYLLCF